MSPELDTLDQLLGGDLPLAAVRWVYPDAARFARGLGGLLAAGDVRLVAAGGAAVPAWRWRAVLAAYPPPPGVTVSLTPSGAARVG